MKTQIVAHCYGPLNSPLKKGEGKIIFFSFTRARTFKGLERVVRKELDKTPSRKNWEVYAVGVGSTELIRRPLIKVVKH